jgi:hypothetical protein
VNVVRGVDRPRGARWPSWFNHSDEGTVRTVALLLGIASLLYAVISVDAVFAQAVYFPVLWYTGALLGVFALPVVLAVLSRSLSILWVKALLGLLGIWLLGIVVTWSFAMTEPSLPLVAGSPWVLGLGVGVAATAAAALPRTLAWAVVVLDAFAILIPLALSPRALVDEALNSVGALVLCLVVVVVVGLSRSTGRRVQGASAGVQRRERRAAEAVARAHEQTRHNAFVHDTVLVTLSLAARDEVGLRPRVAVEAIEALRQLSLAGDVGPGTGTGRASTVAEFVECQRVMAHAADSAIRFSATISGDAHIPAQAQRALGDAATQAVRNSIQHAEVVGHSVRRSVHVHVSASRVELVISDDGAGFELAAVPRSRLGVSISIIGRMAGIQGGAAVVHSVPGLGTEVSISWSAQ